MAIVVTPRPALGNDAPQQLFELNDVDLRVSVSQQYPISRSLVPLSIGHRGAMGFPAREAAPTITAAITMSWPTLFPERQPVHRRRLRGPPPKQDCTNPAFPDFQQGLHDLVRNLACEIDLVINSNANPTPMGGLGHISIVELERTATPAPLQLQLTSNIGVAGPPGAPPGPGGQLGRAAYIGLIVAGSFVRFLIDGYLPDAFHRLYCLTPLKPLHRDAGKPDRWRHVKGYRALSLGDLKKNWKNMISASPCVKDGARRARKAA